MRLEFRAATPDDFEHFLRIERADAAHDGLAAPAPEAVRAQWFGPGTRPYVAELDGAVVGIFRVRPLREGAGSHIGHASFVVDPPHRRRGIGSRMGEHAVAEARRLGFRAMQYPFVPSTLTGSIALWTRLGFVVAGTLPGCYRHPERGDVDAYVLHREFGAG